MAGVQAPAADAAQPAGDDDRGDIVVTGERARRSIRDTASSVEVITAEDIAARPIDRVDDALAATPNVQPGGGSQGPSIRGLDTTGVLSALPAFLGGNRPRTTVVVDSRAVTYNEFVFGAQPLWDVERIEVFRSPQTTTQGQNSIAGAIFVNTADPEFVPDYAVRGIAGNFHTRQVSAMATGPLVDEALAFRVAGDVRYSRTTARITDRAEGADPNHDVYGTVRAKLLATPAGLPNTRLQLTYTHLESQAPQVVQVTAPFRDRFDAGGLYGTFRIRTDSLTASARHVAGDVTASLVLTAGRSLARRYALPGLGQARNAGRDWSGEVVVNWAPDGPVGFIGGVSRKHVALDQNIDLSLISALGTFNDAQDGSGLFGEARFKPLPTVTLTAGLRYQRDRQDRSGVLAAGAKSLPLDYDRTFQAWLPKLSVAVDASDQVTVGAMVQRAYNPGGTTLRFDIGEPDEFEAETLWDYELFARLVSAGGRLHASANLYYYAIRDAQRARSIFIPTPIGPSVGFADLFNVPRAHAYGAEAAVDWRVMPALNARLALGLQRTRLDDAGPAYLEYRGNAFARAPHVSGSAAVEWRPVPEAMLSAQARYHGPYYGDDLNSQAVRVDAAAIVDARAEYRFRRVTAFVYARNLFDKFALLDRVANLRAVPEDPREFGIGLEARFSP
ncbi:TonB-dependent receptor [Sphingomonas sabuli]|uniref:TonB-dependent receptor n=1 Tax=Sphingomonas sabuli TaxID=2764186 RepID=A0A7G9L258_9SPHN|nr:TonB-dependent receptor [Sphingomonas sabuli]QNM82707.1 TonB-dependent receptor [Sphingomonas sabuli]